VGSDAAAGMASWRRIDHLGQMATVAVVDRPGAAGGRPPASIRHEVVPCPLMDLSSSDIRQRAAAGLPLDYLVPDGVRDHIDERGLYS
jgi:nicotinate-nucleotide adenylyltransferase